MDTFAFVFRPKIASEGETPPHALVYVAVVADGPRSRTR